MTTSTLLPVHWKMNCFSIVSRIFWHTLHIKRSAFVPDRDDNVVKKLRFAHKGARKVEPHPHLDALFVALFKGCVVIWVDRKTMALSASSQGMNCNLTALMLINGGNWKCYSRGMLSWMDKFVTLVELRKNLMINGMFWIGCFRDIYISRWIWIYVFLWYFVRSSEVCISIQSCQTRILHRDI